MTDDSNGGRFAAFYFNAHGEIRFTHFKCSEGSSKGFSNLFYQGRFKSDLVFLQFLGNLWTDDQRLQRGLIIARNAQRLL